MNTTTKITLVLLIVFAINVAFGLSAVQAEPRFSLRVTPNGIDLNITPRKKLRHRRKAHRYAERRCRVYRDMWLRSNRSYWLRDYRRCFRAAKRYYRQTR